MKTKPREIYHLYNRGINRQSIFLDRDNYYYFLEKVKTYLAPNCHILAFCLMPNHFHFLITPNERSNRIYRKSNSKPLSKSKGVLGKLTLLSWGLQQLLSTYTRGINKRYSRTGSLFQQNTRLKRTSSDSFLDDYSLWCFIYIHNNPITAGLVNIQSEYEFSSFNDYLENNEDSICNLELAKRLLSFDLNDLFDLKSIEVPSRVIQKLFK